MTKPNKFIYPMKSPPLKLLPFSGKIQISIDKTTAGALDMSGTNVAIEFGEVVAKHPDVESIKVGDRVFFKSFALDIIDYEGEKYYFIDINSKALCAVIK